VALHNNLNLITHATELIASYTSINSPRRVDKQRMKNIWNALLCLHMQRT